MEGVWGRGVSVEGSGQVRVCMGRSVCGGVCVEECGMYVLDC